MREQFDLNSRTHGKVTAQVAEFQTGDKEYLLTIEEKIKTRSISQNARYWVTLDEYLSDIERRIKEVADYSGHTILEVKKLICQELAIEYAAIILTLKPDPTHEILKIICGVPTSTRLGTKAFKEFEERMIETLAQIAGQVNQVTSDWR